MISCCVSVTKVRSTYFVACLQQGVNMISCCIPVIKVRCYLFCSYTETRCDLTSCCVSEIKICSIYFVVVLQVVTMISCVSVIKVRTVYFALILQRGLIMISLLCFRNQWTMIYFVTVLQQYVTMIPSCLAKVWTCSCVTWQKNMNVISFLCSNVVSCCLAEICKLVHLLSCAGVGSAWFVSFRQM